MSGTSSTRIARDLDRDLSDRARQGADPPVLEPSGEEQLNVEALCERLE